MSEEIRFLEALGSSPVLIQEFLRVYEDSVAALDVDAIKRQAFLDKDVGKLSSLLGGRVQMAMNIIAPDGGEESEEAPEHKDDDRQSETELPVEADKPN